MAKVAHHRIWLGVDLGTQGVRVLAVDATGRVLGSGARPLTSRRKDGRHEQDPAEWWRALAEACRLAVSSLDPTQISGIAVDGTSGTVLLANAKGQPVTPGVMYDDVRGAPETERVNRIGEGAWAKAGYFRMQASWALPKLIRLQRELAIPAGDLRLMHQTDFINRGLVGHEVATDTSNALKTGCDLHEAVWPTEVFSALELPMELFPPIVRPGTVLGTVCARAAAELGLVAKILVVAGMTDSCAAQLASGATQPGSWNSVLGTTLAIKGVTAAPLRDPAGVVYSHRSPDGNWLPGGASSSGMGVLAAQLPGRDFEDLGRRAAARGPVALTAYPLVGRGERFPFVAPEAAGFLTRQPVDDIEHYAALFQGVAFTERLCFDYLRTLGAPAVTEVRLTGGAARSDYGCRLRADVLGCPVLVPENPESALGMAILAASGGEGLAAMARKVVRIARRYEPRPGAVEFWREQYLGYVQALAQRGWLPAARAEHLLCR